MREVDFVLETAFAAFQGQDKLLGAPFYGQGATGRDENKPPEGA
jgi:hypothetical protein